MQSNNHSIQTYGARFMHYDKLDWDGLRILLEVARTGSFLRAGDALGVAASTISRRISALEASVATPLVERASDGCRLTARGALLADVARTMDRDLARAYETMRTTLTGTITVASSDGFIPSLTHTAALFENQHPNCTVELHIDNSYTQISKGEADVAIRMANLGEPSLIYQRLTTMGYGYFCTPSLLEALGPLHTPSDLPFVSVLSPLDRSPQAHAATEAGFVRVRLRTNSFAALLEAVRAGIGIAAIPRLTAQGLVEVFHELPIPGADVFLATRPTAARTPHIRAFLDLLHSTLPKFVPDTLHRPAGG